MEEALADFLGVAATDTVRIEFQPTADHIARLRSALDALEEAARSRVQARVLDRVYVAFGRASGPTPNPEVFKLAAREFATSFETFMAWLSTPPRRDPPPVVPVVETPPPVDPQERFPLIKHIIRENGPLFIIGGPVLQESVDALRNKLGIEVVWHDVKKSSQFGTVVPVVTGGKIQMLVLLDHYMSSIEVKTILRACDHARVTYVTAGRGGSSALELALMVLESRLKLLRRFQFWGKDSAPGRDRTRDQSI